LLFLVTQEPHERQQVISLDLMHIELCGRTW
jgi:hypothetical protein